MWRFPFACEVITFGEFTFRATWNRSKILHRRGRLIGIETWQLVNGIYIYTVWGGGPRA